MADRNSSRGGSRTPTSARTVTATAPTNRALSRGSGLNRIQRLQQKSKIEKGKQIQASAQKLLDEGYFEDVKTVADYKTKYDAVQPEVRQLLISPQSVESAQEAKVQTLYTNIDEKIADNSSRIQAEKDKLARRKQRIDERWDKYVKREKQGKISSEKLEEYKKRLRLQEKEYENEAEEDIEYYEEYNKKLQENKAKINIDFTPEWTDIRSDANSWANYRKDKEQYYNERSMNKYEDKVNIDYYTRIGDDKGLQDYFKEGASSYASDYLGKIGYTEGLQVGQVDKDTNQPIGGGTLGLINPDTGSQITIGRYTIPTYTPDKPQTPVQKNVKVTTPVAIGSRIFEFSQYTNLYEGEKPNTYVTQTGQVISSGQADFTDPYTAQKAGYQQTFTTKDAEGKTVITLDRPKSEIAGIDTQQYTPYQIKATLETKDELGEITTREEMIDVYYDAEKELFVTKYGDLKPQEDEEELIANQEYTVITEEEEGEEVEGEGVGDEEEVEEEIYIDPSIKLKSFVETEIYGDENTALDVASDYATGTMDTLFPGNTQIPKTDVTDDMSVGAQIAENYRVEEGGFDWEEKLGPLAKPVAAIANVWYGEGSFTEAAIDTWTRQLPASTWKLGKFGIQQFAKGYEKGPWTGERNLTFPKRTDEVGPGERDYSLENVIPVGIQGVGATVRGGTDIVGGLGYATIAGLGDLLLTTGSKLKTGFKKGLPGLNPESGDNYIMEFDEAGLPTGRGVTGAAVEGVGATGRTVWDGTKWVANAVFAGYGDRQRGIIPMAGRTLKQGWDEGLGTVGWGRPVAGSGGRFVGALAKSIPGATVLGIQDLSSDIRTGYDTGFTGQAQIQRPNPNDPFYKRFGQVVSQFPELAAEGVGATGRVGVDTTKWIGNAVFAGWGDPQKGIIPVTSRKLKTGFDKGLPEIYKNPEDFYVPQYDEDGLITGRGVTGAAVESVGATARTGVDIVGGIGYATIAGWGELLKTTGETFKTGYDDPSSAYINVNRDQLGMTSMAETRGRPVRTLGGATRGVVDATKWIGNAVFAGYGDRERGIIPMAGARLKQGYQEGFDTVGWGTRADGAGLRFVGALGKEVPRMTYEGLKDLSGDIRTGYDTTLYTGEAQIQRPDPNDPFYKRFGQVVSQFPELAAEGVGATGRLGVDVTKGIAGMTALGYFGERGIFRTGWNSFTQGYREGPDNIKWGTPVYNESGQIIRYEGGSQAAGAPTRYVGGKVRGMVDDYLLGWEQGEKPRETTTVTPTAAQLFGVEDQTNENLLRLGLDEEANQINVVKDDVSLSQKFGSMAKDYYLGLQGEGIEGRGEPTNAAEVFNLQNVQVGPDGQLMSSANVFGLEDKKYEQPDISLTQKAGIGTRYLIGAPGYIAGEVGTGIKYSNVGATFGASVKDAELRRRIRQYKDREFKGEQWDNFQTATNAAWDVLESANDDDGITEEELQNTLTNTLLEYGFTREEYEAKADQIDNIQSLEDMYTTQEKVFQEKAKAGEYSKFDRLRGDLYYGGKDYVIPTVGGLLAFTPAAPVGVGIMAAYGGTELIQGLEKLTDKDASFSTLLTGGVETAIGSAFILGPIAKATGVTAKIGAGVQGARASVFGAPAKKAVAKTAPTVSRFMTRTAALKKGAVMGGISGLLSGGIVGYQTYSKTQDIERALLTGGTAGLIVGGLYTTAGYIKSAGIFQYDAPKAVLTSREKIDKLYKQALKDEKAFIGYRTEIPYRGFFKDSVAYSSASPGGGKNVKKFTDVLIGQGYTPKEAKSLVNTYYQPWEFDKLTNPLAKEYSVISKELGNVVTRFDADSAKKSGIQFALNKYQIKPNVNIPEATKDWVVGVDKIPKAVLEGKTFIPKTDYVTEYAFRFFGQENYLKDISGNLDDVAKLTDQQKLSTYLGDKAYSIATKDPRYYKMKPGEKLIDKILTDSGGGPITGRYNKNFIYTAADYNDKTFKSIEILKSSRYDPGYTIQNLYYAGREDDVLNIGIDLKPKQQSMKYTLREGVFNQALDLDASMKLSDKIKQPLMVYNVATQTTVSKPFWSSQMTSQEISRTLIGNDPLNLYGQIWDLTGRNVQTPFMGYNQLGRLQYYFPTSKDAPDLLFQKNYFRGGISENFDVTRSLKPGPSTPFFPSGPGTNAINPSTSGSLPPGPSQPLGLRRLYDMYGGNINRPLVDQTWSPAAASTRGTAPIITPEQQKFLAGTGPDSAQYLDDLNQRVAEMFGAPSKYSGFKPFQNVDMVSYGRQNILLGYADDGGAAAAMGYTDDAALQATGQGTNLYQPQVIADNTDDFMRLRRLIDNFGRSGGGGREMVIGSGGSSMGGGGGASMGGGFGDDAVYESGRVFDGGSRLLTKKPDVSEVMSFPQLFSGRVQEIPDYKFATLVAPGQYDMLYQTAVLSLGLKDRLKDRLKYAELEKFAELDRATKIKQAFKITPQEKVKQKPETVTITKVNTGGGGGGGGGGIVITPNPTPPVPIPKPKPKPPKPILPRFRFPPIGIPLFPWLDGEGKDKKKDKNKKKKKLVGLTPDFTARALGLSPEKLTKKQAVKEAKKVKSGGELRLGVELLDMPELRAIDRF